MTQAYPGFSFWGCTFFLKVDDLFSHSHTQAKVAKLTPPTLPRSAKISSKKWTSCSVWSVHLQLTRINYAPKIFSLAMGVHVHPLTTPMT